MLVFRLSSLGNSDDSDELTKEIKQNNNKLLLNSSPTAFQRLTINFYLNFVAIKSKSIPQRKHFKIENKGSTKNEANHVS